MKLKIKITQEVLEATKMCGIGNFKLPDSTTPRISYNCAITYACRKLFPNCVTKSFVIILYYFEANKATKIVKLPESASRFIETFDELSPKQRVKMQPFEFEITLTDAALELINIDEATKIFEESTTLEVV